MQGFLTKVAEYTRDAVNAANYLAQGLSVTFDHMRRRPVTVQYPYEKLIIYSTSIFMPFCIDILSTSL